MSYINSLLLKIDLNYLTIFYLKKMSTDNVTPWKVEGFVDYLKLIQKFGCDPIDGKLIKRFEQVTQTKAHCWLRRGIFFSNKDLKDVLDDYEQGKQVYLYTGRGPSSESLRI